MFIKRLTHIGRIIIEIKIFEKYLANLMSEGYKDKCTFQVYICIAAKMGVLLQKHTIEVSISVYKYK